MLQTYKAILRGNRLEWAELPPPTGEGQPILVYVTLLEAMPLAPEENSPNQQMVAILEQLAQLQPQPTITNPTAWQRAQRWEQPLIGREE